jgi:hypothetical protein
MEMQSDVPVREAQISAVVLRCICGDPASHPNMPCPAAFHEDRGVIAYYHRSVIKRIAWRLRRLWRRVSG